MGALRDCEAVIDGLFSQPVNSVTSLVFIIAGATVVRNGRQGWLAAALAATGVGSFLFHGPMPGYGEWAHDVSLAWLVLVVGGSGRPWARWTHVPGLLAIGFLFAGVPDSADPTAVVLSVVAGMLLLDRDRSFRTLVPLILLAVVAVVGRLGATDGPWCDPESILQPHGLWHIGAATAVTWWAIGTQGR